MFTRILVPLDGSLLAEHALPAAEETARLHQCPLELIQVIDLNRLDHYGIEGLVGAAHMADQLVVAEREVTEYLESVATNLREHGLTVSIMIRSGDPARELIDAATTGDLIVMATHGRGGVARVFLGSVAETVLRRASAPVLLVRANATQPPTDLSEMSRLLRRERYRPAELGHLLGMEVAHIQHAALTKQLPAQIIDHHVLWIDRADALNWLRDQPPHRT